MWQIIRPRHTASRVYAQPLKGEVHYHDESGLEADAVISLRDGRYVLIEAKTSAGDIKEGAKSLRKLADKVDKGIMGPPSFCAVVVPGGFAYQRPDGILILPITCLRD